jgi:SWI/SNF-related matrix-associated actin-dependent regulator 1 of chromatin subfamily A
MMTTTTTTMMTMRHFRYGAFSTFSKKKMSGHMNKKQKAKKKEYVKPWVEWQLDKNPDGEFWWASLWLINGDAKHAYFDFPKLLATAQIQHQWGSSSSKDDEKDVSMRLCIPFRSYAETVILWKENYPNIPMSELDPWHLKCVEIHRETMNRYQVENRTTRLLWKQKFIRLFELSNNTHVELLPVELIEIIMQYAYDKWYEIAFPKIWEMTKPYQKTGVDFLVRRRGCGILADDMGLGKTLQAILVTMVYAQARPCLIICPKSLFGNWQQSLTRFVYGGKPIDSNQILSIRSSAEFETHFSRVTTTLPAYIILSFGLITRIVNNKKASTSATDVLKKIQFLLIDESHACKNVTSQRTAALLQVAKNVPHRLCLSGTPACKPKEVYPQWVIACPTLPPRVALTNKKEVETNLLRWAVSNDMSQEQFTKLLYEHVQFSFCLRWCRPTLKVIRKGSKKIPKLWIDGSERLHELYCILKMSCMLHRPKSILEKDLPDLMRYKISFRAPILAQRQYEKSTREIQKLAHDVERRNTIYMREFNENIFTAKKDFAQFYLLWLLRSKRYQGQKFIFYAHHKIFMQYLAQFLRDNQIQHVVIQGDTLGEDRTAAEQNFQTNADYRVALISVMAGGTGLNLQAASIVVFCELIWSPDVMLQAEARVNRLGQTKKVECHYLVADPSLDELILRIYRCKNVNSGMILTGQARRVPFHSVIDLSQFPPVGQQQQQQPWLSDDEDNGEKNEAEEEMMSFLETSFDSNEPTQEEEKNEDENEEETENDDARELDLLRLRFL